MTAASLLFKALVRPKFASLATAIVLLSVAGSGAALAETLGSAVVTAIKTHPSGLASLANQRAVANELQESISAFRPQADAFGDIGAEVVNNPNSLSSSDSGSWKATRQVGVSLSYTLFDGYERANILYRNAARLDTAIFEVLSTAETVGLSAVEAYIDVVRHLDLLHIASKNIATHQRILQQIRARVEGGKAPQSDSFQIEERVIAAKTVKAEVEKAYQDSLAKYRKVVGRAPKGKLSNPKMPRLPRNVAQATETAVANNYEIQAAARTVSQNRHAREAEAGALSPKFFLEGRASVGADRGGSRGAESNAYVGVRMAWKLYDGGIRDSRESAAAERVAQSQSLRDLKIREVREIVERSWHGYRNGAERAGLLDQQVKANTRIVANYKEEYELSKRSLLDVLDAERALFNARFQYISVSAGYRFSAYRLLAAQSRLAKHFGIQPTSIAPNPVVEQNFLGRSTHSFGSAQSIFDVNIEPLK